LPGKDLTTRILERSLEAASLRQQTLANNIANVNTPGFKRSRVEFEQHLAEALKVGDDPTTVRAQLTRETTSQGRPDGNNVDIEFEMTGLAENQIWHAALTRQITDHFARLRMAIHEGRR
jgi:flagellar basal-body rod protein FlgB